MFVLFCFVFLDHVIQYVFQVSYYAPLAPSYAHETGQSPLQQLEGTITPEHELALASQFLVCVFGFLCESSESLSNVFASPILQGVSST